MAIDELDPTPLWEQLAALLREQIQAGDLQPRERVPSEAVLQREYDVSRGTVRRAMQALGEVEPLRAKVTAAGITDTRTGVFLPLR